jgi:Mg-chelatase subunit ChlD
MRCVISTFYVEVPMRVRSILSSLSVAALLAGCMSTPAVRPEAAGALVEPMMEGEPVIIAEEAAVADARAPAPSSTPRERYTGPVRRGVVTAGDIDDALNLGSFLRYLDRGVAGLPRLGLGQPVMARLTGPDGTSAPGARYTLRRVGAADSFHTGYAGPDGRITDFPRILGAGEMSQAELRVFGPDGAEIARQTLATGTRQTVALSQATTWDPQFLDLVIVIDTTGSMDDEIAFLQRELIGITRAAARAAPGTDIRFGLVAYRDQGDAYVVQNYGFTGRTATMTGWLRGLSAGGGGDYPEAAAAALQSVTAMDWRTGQGERLVLHIADAPPHDVDAATYLRAGKSAAVQGVQIFTLGASGVAAESEYLMRQASLVTGGRYLFLTDDSGVGNDHAEPTIPCYRVTDLTGLLTRVLTTELTGIRQEAPASGVTRTVGSYANGVCRD